MSALISPLSIAPMIDWTNSPFRMLMRFIAPQCLVYTEMQTVGAIENKPERALFFDLEEQPIALQLGGSEPKSLAACAKKAEQIGFSEININLGCPSDRVLAGKFGACLMAQPQVVADCLKAIKDAVSIPVSAKTRIGIDNHDSYDFFFSFAEQLIAAGSDKLIIHARKAWLHGLNPKQNRTIPPVNYAFVYQLKDSFPKIPIVINGNINHLAEIKTHLSKVDGVMLGRLACNNPFALAEIHNALYPHEKMQLTRNEVLQRYLNYMESQLNKNTAVSMLIKPLFNYYSGCPGNKEWKKNIQSILQTRKIDKIQPLNAQ